MPLYVFLVLKRCTKVWKHAALIAQAASTEQV